MEIAIPAFQGILILLVIGFLMVAAEVFVPGMILGILGALCLVAAIGWSYVEFGAFHGTMVLIGVFTFGGIGFVVCMSNFTKTFLGRQVVNKNVLVSDPNEKRKALLGKSGVAVTALRPSGVARINGARVDVVAESSFIDAAQNVTVVTVEGNRVVVRKNA